MASSDKSTQQASTEQLEEQSSPRSLEAKEGLAFVLDLNERRRAEEALRESEERFRTVVHFSFDVYWETDAQHRFIRQEFSDSLADAPEPGSEIGKTRWEVPYLEPDAEAWRKHRETLDAHLPFRDFELARPTPDGGKRYVSVSGLPVFDKMGRFVGYRGVGRHITDRRRTEQALRDSEEQWKAVFENNPTMYFMVDAAGTIVSVNPIGAEQLGYTVGELIGRPVLNVFYEPDREAVQRSTAACLEQPGRALTWELRKIRKNGSMLWVRETGSAMLIKGRLVVLIACEDITQRKRAEYLTGQVFDTYPDAICVIGRDYRYQRVNPVYERDLGMPADLLVGTHVADLLGITFFDQTLKPNYERCFAGEEVRYTEWVTYPRSRRRYLSVSYSPLRPASDRVEAILVITRDLTDHVLASEALRSAQAELAHANRVAAMGQLTASIAHEVNQPIAATVINAQAGLRFLGAQAMDLNKIREILSEIVKDGNRAGEVISRIRDLIKKAPPRRDRWEINGAIREVIELTRGEAVKNGISVQMELADGLPLIRGDRVQLQQVLLNLIINAIEAMSDLGDGARELLISTGKIDSDGVLVTVRDSGPGLAPATLERVFESFYTTKPSGLGMGLSICRSIVEAHGGRLWASADIPRGATFQFTVPEEGMQPL
jgi:PAS domain S-box-containing protein